MTIALGKACRLLRFLPDDKTYKATIRLGLITDTDDIEGKVLAEDKSATDNPPSRELVAAALLDFKGDIEQIPPYFSAIHVDGQRLYELARKGQPPPDIKARPVTIHSIDLLDYQAPEITIRVHCSKGTYIRSIARDLGQKLGPGGTLSGLVRESAGKFQLMQSADLSDNNLLDRLVTVEEAVALPQMTMPTSLAKRLALGQKIALSDLPPDANHPGQDAEYVLVLGADSGRAFCAGRLGLSEIDGQPYIAPEVVFADV